MKAKRRPRPTDYAAEDALRITGDHLGAWRRLQGLTQAQVAERAGVSRGAVVRAEAGEPGTTMDTFLRVLGALHVTESLTTALDPYRSDVGIARADELLPQRVRRA